MAEVAWEALAKADNEFYKRCPVPADYVPYQWKNYIEAARAQMASMLSMPIPQEQKDLIIEAITLDNGLRTQRMNSMRVLG